MGGSGPFTWGSLAQTEQICILRVLEWSHAGLRVFLDLDEGGATVKNFLHRRLLFRRQFCRDALEDNGVFALCAFGDERVTGAHSNDECAKIRTRGCFLK